MGFMKARYGANWLFSVIFSNILRWGKLKSRHTYELAYFLFCCGVTIVVLGAHFFPDSSRIGRIVLFSSRIVLFSSRIDCSDSRIDCL